MVNTGTVGCMTDETKSVTTTELAVCYGRVSTREQAERGHGLAAQREKTEGYCALMGMTRTEWISDEGASGAKKPHERPGLGRALKMLASGEADALVVPALDRLGRSALDVLGIADCAETQQWRLAVVGQMDSGSPEGRATLTVMAAMAELERGLNRRRTTEGLRAAKRAGKRLGRPPSPHTRAAGARVAALRAEGATWRAIPAVLDTEGFRRADGTQRPWNVRAARDALTTVTLDAEAEAARKRHTNS
ncbi:recombinase family protein [Candidatus Poriferisodalis sp.]|uniref:recombinase family protein n=1 Tax=Candidatus Poriferisodalis sp. TaxID=3101277 RepID=UPI003B527337